MIYVTVRDAYDFMAAMWVAILVCESRERK
jgi:hypothetical protein